MTDPYDPQGNAGTDGVQERFRGAQERVGGANWTRNGTPIDIEMAAFLDGVIGVVEANSYERLCLWQEHHKRMPWKQRNDGYGQTVGHFGDMPVHVSLVTAEVDGHKLLFIDATSQVVDHRLIDEWLKKAMPPTAYRDGTEYINRVAAMNFHNVLPRRPQSPE